MSIEDVLASATHIEVQADVRYWEDATVDGVEDTDGVLIPGRDAELPGSPWHVRIELDGGRIEHWPEGTSADIHYKVCDQGLYWLTDAAGLRIARYRSSYVPDAYLSQGDAALGDYIVMRVDGSGSIEGFRRPVADPDRWERL